MPPRALPLLLILLGAVLIRLPILDVPFHRNTEGAGSIYGIMARNYLRHDWHHGWGLPMHSVGVSPAGDPPLVYAHHPPLVPWLIGLSTALFGDGEWQTRLPAALFTLGCIILIHRLLIGRAGPRGAALAALLFAASPIAIRLGGQPDVINPQLIFFVLLTLAAYLRFYQSPDWNNLSLLAIAFLPAAFTDWPAFFLVPVLLFHLLWKRPRDWAWAMAFGFIATAIFALLYAYLSVATGDWTMVMRLFLSRSVRSQLDQGSPFTWWQWLTGVGGHLQTNFSLPLLVAAGAGLVWRDRRDAATPTRLLLAWALLHVLIGRQGVLVHTWWWWPAAPGIAMAAGLMIDRLIRGPTSYGILVAALSAWCAWSIWINVRFFRDPRNILNPPMDYTIVEIGRAIQLAAPKNIAVVVVENDDEPSLWYYADRPLITNVWDEYTLDQRLRDGRTDLMFGFRQKWSPPPRAVVFPKIYQDAAPLFLRYLREHHAERDAGKFFIFDLSDRRG